MPKGIGPPRAAPPIAVKTGMVVKGLLLATKLFCEGDPGESEISDDH